MQSLHGPGEVALRSQSFTFSASSPSPMELIRIINLQMIKLHTEVPVQTNLVFWVGGGTNQKYLAGYDVPYCSPVLGAPSDGSGFVFPEPAILGSEYKNCFKVFLGPVYLIFRFSPSMNFPATVEYASDTPEQNEVTISFLAIEPTRDRNLQSRNGHYGRRIRNVSYRFASSEFPIGNVVSVRREIGPQFWNFMIMRGDGSLSNLGTVFFNYGLKDDTGGYIGTTSSMATASVFFRDGSSTAVAAPVSEITKSQRQFTQVFLVTIPAVESIILEITIDPEQGEPTVKNISTVIGVGEFFITELLFPQFIL